MVAVVGAGGIDNAVIQSPALAQTMFLRQKHFPAVDALAVLRKEVEFIALQQTAVQQLVGRRTIIGQFHTRFQAEGSTVVQTTVVKPIRTVTQRGGLL